MALMPEYLAGVAKVNQPCPVEPLLLHNPLATFTTRGWPNGCGFCAVPRIEGELRELPSWRPAPLVCDNNLLAASRRHFDKVIDSLKPFPAVDFNQGLDARLLTAHHASRLAELKAPKIRFAFDHVNDEARVHDAIELCRAHGLRDFTVYCLIGFDDDPESARWRLETVLKWGARTSPMRYQPLDALAKDSHAAPGWTDGELRRLARFYFRQAHFGGLPYDEFMISRKPGADGPRLF